METFLNIFDFSGDILFIIGCWKIFKKCGLKKWSALIPILREYNLSQCADRREDGIVYGAVFLVYNALELPLQFDLISRDNQVGMIFSVTILTLHLIAAIYMIRIYIGLCKTFDASKKWVVSFVLFQGITMLYWGFSSAFQPLSGVSGEEGEGAGVSGATVKAFDDGLNVNINERTTMDFFRKKVLLKDIHMHIPKGHMVLLLGGSGAGKTTFVNAVTGYEQADAKIFLREKDLYKEYQNMKYDVGFVPQQELMRGHDTVLLTLTDAAALRLPTNMNFKDSLNRIKDVLSQFGLSAVRGSLVEKLSGGQKKRLSIAMEFISDPTLFILDEPDSGLDGVVARGLFEKLRAIADEGKIVIVITHTPDRVIDLFDDVIVLAKDSGRTGRLAYYGPVDKAYEFFDKKSCEGILLSVNQKDEGGEGRADEYVSKYAEFLKEEQKQAG